MNLPRHFTLASLVGLGAALGIVAHQTGSGALLLLASVVEPFGALWTDAVRMMVIPLIVSFLFVSVASFDDIGKTGHFALNPSTVEAFRESAAGGAEARNPPERGVVRPHPSVLIRSRAALALAARVPAPAHSGGRPTRIDAAVPGLVRSACKPRDAGRLAEVKP